MSITVGIVGGMGSYATVDFFRRIVDAFPAAKEWDRPRVLIDNYCTMPSRVRAVLYNERREELADDLSSSVSNLLRAGADRIIFACSTSHIFLPEVIARVPECAGRIIHIIEACAREISLSSFADWGGGLGLIATEGTIETGIYEQIFSRYSLKVNAPGSSQYEELRYFIEAVKQNNVTEEVLVSFHDYVEGFSEGAVILGCTEMPILYRKCIERGLKFQARIYDPLQSAIDIIAKLHQA